MAIPQPAPQVPYPAVPPSIPPAVVAGMPPGVYPAQPMIPGQPFVPGQPMYAGQPIYYVPPQTAVHQTVHQVNLLHSLQARIQSIASTEELEGFSLGQMFSEVFKRRSNEELEDYIGVGTQKTTPSIDLVETGWPRPWLFFRLLVTLVVAYAALAVIFMQTGNENCIPGIMFIGSFAMPISTLVLFFELNSPRNVSMHTIAKLFLFGAIVSLAVALLGYSLPIFDLMTAEAGIVEEVAKLLTVVLVMRSIRYKYMLNGILFGATVGAGFAAFETAGYALNKAFLPGLFYGLTHGGDMGASLHMGVSQMLSILLLRGVLTPLGHVAWTAIAAGAFWRVKQDKPLSASMLFDRRFLKAFAIPVILHAIWDAPWQLPWFGNAIITGLITWYVVFGLVQQGLRQVKTEQKDHLQATLNQVEASMQPQGSVAV